jgi:hypothetical protein
VKRNTGNSNIIGLSIELGLFPLTFLMIVPRTTVLIYESVTLTVYKEGQRNSAHLATRCRPRIEAQHPCRTESTGQPENSHEVKQA